MARSSRRLLSSLHYLPRLVLRPDRREVLRLYITYIRFGLRPVLPPLLIRAFVSVLHTSVCLTARFRFTSKFNSSPHSEVLPHSSSSFNLTPFYSGHLLLSLQARHPNFTLRSRCSHPPLLPRLSSTQASFCPSSTQCTHPSFV